ncbi:DNA-directed RNA polymerase subunit delta [Sporolactobacillus sp. THM7-4]|nr:DNA-directed RNA polymerase subunit delta [Sporolactobacillus sp. THM7-4]
MFPLTEHAIEKSKVDQLYDILAQSKEPKSFYEMTDQIFKDDEIKADGGETLARLYTTLTLDGRFLSIGSNLWALRKWYPMEQREDDVAKTLGKNISENRSKIADDGFDDYDDVDDDEDIDEDDYGDGSEEDEDSADDEDTFDDDTVQQIKKNMGFNDEEE